MPDSPYERVTSKPTVSAILRGVATLEAMLDLIGDPDGADEDVAKLLVDGEEDLRALATFALERLREVR